MSLDEGSGVMPHPEYGVTHLRPYFPALVSYNRPYSISNRQSEWSQRLLAKFDTDLSQRSRLSESSRPLCYDTANSFQLFRRSGG